MTVPGFPGLEEAALASLRAQFPILGRTTYLISNSLGAVPRQAGLALQEYYETWANRGVRAWEECWWTMAADLGNLVAPLIGASPQEVTFQPAVTLTHAMVLSALNPSPTRYRVVTDAMHFPSILYLLQEMPAIELVVVPSSNEISVSTGRLVEAIDQRTLCVALSHVLFKSSYIHDVRTIATRAREVGALTIFDGYQAVGTIPVDVRDIGADVYIGGCLKWLCGGPGAAFLWVDPAHHKALKPKITGWMAHQRPFAFEPEHDPRDDHWRFLQGTPNISALYAAREGLQIINTLGIQAIRQKSIRQTGLTLELAQKQGWTTKAPTNPRERGGTVAIDVPHGLAVSRALKHEEILCDYRPGAGIRFSPHFYSTDAEIAHAMNRMSEIVTDGAWQKFEATRSPVT